VVSVLFALHYDIQGEHTDQELLYPTNHVDEVVCITIIHGVLKKQFS
jgi:hypothetical protein